MLMGRGAAAQGPASIQGEDPSPRIDGGPSPPVPASLVGALPEPAKLALASLFVALLLHAFFAARRRDKSEGAPIVRGRVGAVGTATGGDPGGAEGRDGRRGESESGDDKREEGQVIGGAELDKEVGKKKKASRNDVANRNYDALVCKKDEGSVDDLLDGSTSKPVKKTHKGKSRKRNKQKLQPNVGDVTDDVTSSVDGELSKESSPLPPPPPIELKSQAKHPGLRGYCNWHATITSLYRIYAIPSYSYDSSAPNGRRHNQAILPMHPSSERGLVSLYIEVTNRTSHENIYVYWVDYKGNEIEKGVISNRGGPWSQTTYVGHPWTFRVGEGEENVLLRYAPFRVVPSIEGVETAHVEHSGHVEGMQKFVIRDAPEGHVSQHDGSTPACWVEDAVLPEPPLILSSKFDDWRTGALAPSSLEIDGAVRWSCRQIQREDAVYPGNGIASAKRLLRYLKNVCLHPDDPKYRRLRLGNCIFREAVYDTGGRGVLLALGFEEHCGYMECGPGGGKVLRVDRIQQISDAMEVVHWTLTTMEGGQGPGASAQPEGADGFGRAGFGHAGGMNQ
ncbi:hypothetical protein ACHAWF_012781 [Thalassiosira exigua]